MWLHVLYIMHKTVANLATKVDKYDGLNMTHVCKNTLNKYRHKFSKHKYKFINKDNMKQCQKLIHLFKL
jgi:hypothetical protein